MALDFTTGVLDSRVTVTRALNTATRINSSGLVEIVNANLPRFDYNLTTLAPKGLLIEESRTNICEYSEDFLTGWGNFGGSYTPNSGTSPSGSGNATLVTNTSGGAFRYWPLVVVGTYTVSVWAKGITGTETLRLQSAPSGTVIGYGLTTQWARYTLTYTGTWTRFVIYLDTTAQQCLLWGAQVEAGAFATSYIPTSGATVTRNADVVSMTGTNFSDWYNASEGTFVATTSVLNLALNRPIMQTATSGLSNGSQYVYYNPASSRFGYRVYDATGTTVGAVNYTNAGTPVINTPYCAAIGYKTDSFAISVNGATVGLDTLGTVSGAADTLLIGSDTSITYLNGHAKSLRFYPLRLTNAETQAFSKG